LKQILFVSCLVACWLVAFSAQAVPVHIPMGRDLRSSIEQACASMVGTGEHVNLAEFADAVASASNGNADWAALIIAVAFHESSLSSRIASGQCKPLECDPAHVHGVLVHRAWGLMQEHSNTHNEHDWGSVDIAVQVASGDRALRRAYWNCARFNRKGASPEVWVQSTLSSYAGRGCGDEWAGLNKRLSTWMRVRGKL